MSEKSAVQIDKSIIECVVLRDTDNGCNTVLRVAVVGSEIFLDICHETANNGHEYNLKRVAQVVVSWHEFVNLLYAIQEVSQ